MYSLSSRGIEGKQRGVKVEVIYGISRASEKDRTRARERAEDRERIKINKITVVYVYSSS